MCLSISCSNLKYTDLSTTSNDTETCTCVCPFHVQTLSTQTYLQPAITLKPAHVSVHFMFIPSIYKIPTSPKIGLHLPTLAHISQHWPTSPKIGLHLPALAYISQHWLTSLKIGLHLPTLAYISQHWPTSPNTAQHWLTSPKIGQHLPTLANISQQHGNKKRQLT